MQESDGFVLPTRGEAWGLPILEAMACGLPCIVTDFGGHRAFANATNSYLIEVDALVPVCDPLNFDPSSDWGAWAQPSVEHLQALMRDVFDHPRDAAERGCIARLDATTWSWDQAAAEALIQLPAS